MHTREVPRQQWVPWSFSLPQVGYTTRVEQGSPKDVDMSAEPPNGGASSGAVSEPGGPADESVGVETLPDGSVSIPILEEELVVRKRRVVRERILVRKRIEMEEERVEVELALERLDVEADEGLLDEDEGASTERREQGASRAAVRALLTVDDIPTLRNIPVIAADGVELGRVGDAFYDEGDRRLRLVGVASDPVGLRRLLVPLDGAVLADDGLRVRYTKPELERLPNAPEDLIRAEQSAREPIEPERSAGAALVRHEEELQVGKRVRELGAVRARKRIETQSASELVGRAIEHFEDVEHLPPNEDDSAEIETLPDGSVSIPILEEQLVVTKRPVVRERVLIRKHAQSERYRIEAKLRREQIDVDEHNVRHG